MAGKVRSMLKISGTPSVFKVDNFPWDNGGVKPETYAELSYDDGGYRVLMVSYETELRAVETAHNSPVHEDSCMEFFAAFSEDDVRYINFEVNPNGAAHCEFGEGRGSRVCLDPSEIDALGITTRVYDDRWEVSYYIQKELIEKYLPTYRHEKGRRIRANFYKCGDKTGHEHYGCFNNIPWQHPDFHRPEFFAHIELA